MTSYKLALAPAARTKHFEFYNILELLVLYLALIVFSEFLDLTPEFYGEFVAPLPSERERERL